MSLNDAGLISSMKHIYNTSFSLFLKTVLIVYPLEKRQV